MSTSAALQNLGSVRMKRYKARIACNTCRRRKLKCDGLRPACSRCQKDSELRESCSYAPTSRTRKNSSSRSFEKESYLKTPLGLASSRTKQLESEDSPSIYGDSNLGVDFVVKLGAAIDNKLGVSTAPNRCPIPLLDAPMFGSFDLVFKTGHPKSQSDDVLPPRRHADYLVNLYWQHLEPHEPLFDQTRFSLSYDALFTGKELDCNERIFLATLNTIFALSTQLQESIPSEQRVEVSKSYFKRAWSLLNLESILYEQPSLEIVQCLILITRYLQCMKGLHQMWMIAGTTVRIAQSLGLHLPETVALDPQKGDIWLRRQVWQSCLFLERTISWSLGRTSMVSLSMTSVSMEAIHNNTNAADNHIKGTALFQLKLWEFHEIAGHVMFSQLSGNSNFANYWGLPNLHPKTDLDTALQIDECFNRYEKSLPSWLTYEYVSENGDDTLNGQRILLQLRFLHGRVLLFRPMLARVCLTQPATEKGNATIDNGLKDRILQEGARFCVENAQKMIALLYNNYRSCVVTNSIPWWYRIFYLYIATQHLVAAMLRPDVFTDMVMDSWSKSMSAFQAHEHISPCVQRCIASFQSMWQKVVDMPHLEDTQAAPPEELSNEYLQDILQHLVFESEHPLFGTEHLAWPGDAGWT